MSRFIGFNVNDKVKVKLTKVGKDELKRQWDIWHFDYPGVFIEYSPKKEDYQGFSEWQMHFLMRDLGHMMSMESELPFETNIMINIDLGVE